MKKYKVGNECIIEVRNLEREGRDVVVKSTNVKGTISKAFQRCGKVLYYIDTYNGGTVYRQHHEIYLIPVFTKIKIL